MNSFPTTHWSLIERAYREAPTGSREQMGKLLEEYRQPMYSHLRYKGLTHEGAEDLIQDFMLEILNNNLLAIADPRRGKFRTLLLTALDHFAVSRHRYETAAKRSAGELASIDALETDITTAPDRSPAAAFERAWALDVLARALAGMQQNCEKSGEAARWLVFERRIVAPLLDDVPVPEYAELSREMGLQNEKATMNLLVTAKRQFARTLREQIREYVTRSGDQQQAVEELANRLSDTTDDKTAHFMAGQLITQVVEDEIDQLKEILSRTRLAADRKLDAARESTPLKSAFWRRLTRQSSKPLGQLYDWDQEDGSDIPMHVSLQSVLDSPIHNFVGGYEGTIRSYLCDESPDVEALESIKEWANTQRATGSQALPGDLASVVYYGAISAALVRCGKRITGLNDQALLTGLRSVGEQAWLDNSLRSMIEHAIILVDN
jgi:RNA polymerase sigma-70 factor (ECF subfamily)